MHRPRMNNNQNNNNKKNSNFILDLSKDASDSDIEILPNQ